MKHLSLLLLISMGIYNVTFAQNVKYNEAIKAAENTIALMYKNNSHIMKHNINETGYQNDKSLYYIFELVPSGYIVVTSRRELPPVIAYSTTNNFVDYEDMPNPLRELLDVDIESRIASIERMSQMDINDRKQEWKNLLLGLDTREKLFTQWPEYGTTTTGGWIETNWTQSYPYDKFCPMDPVTSQRSYVGCPATAMGQIVNYYQQINSTTFDDNDDYYHSYAGRNYWIDDDYKDHDFLCFPDINNYLDTIAIKYDDGSALSNDDRAALSFACGVAAHQVYSSAGSGTFGVNQAFDAYMKFGFADAVLMYDTDTSLFTIMSQNIMDARPVHLAVVNEQGNSGHNVVADGYNTDDYYHINFGWGGSNNGWYLLPHEFPLGLTVIEGIVANIAYPTINTSVFNSVAKSNLNVAVYPNPVSDFIVVETELVDGKELNVSIINLTGKTLYQTKSNAQKFSIKLGEVLDTKLRGGIYFLKVETSEISGIAIFVVQ